MAPESQAESTHGGKGANEKIACWDESRFFNKNQCFTESISVAAFTPAGPQGEPAAQWGRNQSHTHLYRLTPARKVLS